jgi:hypothetical protein
MGKMRLFNVMACSIEAFRMIEASVLDSTRSEIFILGAPKNPMSNMKLINTCRRIRRSSNRLGSLRKDGSLRGRSGPAQHIDRAAVSMALAGISQRRRANSFDEAQANCGRTDLPKRSGLFG